MGKKGKASYVCECCGKRFWTIPSLCRHIEKESKIYYDEVIGKMTPEEYEELKLSIKMYE